MVLAFLLPARAAPRIMMSNRTASQLRGRSWRVLKDRFRERCQQANAPCWLCDQAINYEAKWTDPSSFEADHFKPVSTPPHLALMIGTLRPSHQSCNRSRGNKPAATAWVRAEW